jgi:hypothetical protein
MSIEFCGFVIVNNRELVTLIGGLFESPFFHIVGLILVLPRAEQLWLEHGILIRVKRKDGGNAREVQGQIACSEENSQTSDGDNIFHFHIRIRSLKQNYASVAAV